MDYFDYFEKKRKEKEKELANTISLYEQGIDALNKDDYKTATLHLIEALEPTDPEAQYNWGVMYYSGKNEVKQDYKKALYWFNKAAEQEYAAAERLLGGMYHEGNGVKQDYSKAYEYFKLGTEHGDANAQFNLGVYYLNGIFVEKDEKLSFEYILHAAEHGDDSAKYCAGMMYMEGVGTQMDKEKALYWLKKAERSGVEKAATALRELEEEASESADK